MPSLASLRSQLSNVNTFRMVADGYCLWISWEGEDNPVITQTLEDYGGVQIVSESQQALWFFFSVDIFLAAARLTVWSRFNPLTVMLQLFPARLHVGSSGEKSLVFDEALWKQQVSVGPTFQAWVHSGLEHFISSVPGASLKKQSPVNGMSAGTWFLLDADARLPYQSTLGWYAILHPLGNPVDKAFQAGWREFFAHIETILQRNKFRFTVHNYFLMFPLDGLRQFKNWVTDFLALVVRIKTETPESYWPCVLSVVERKGLNFNEELPSKVNIDWDQLSPDYPHMSMRSALMLGAGFAFHDVRFSVASQSSDDWTSVSLYDPLDDIERLPQLLPDVCLQGHNPYCFYCGQRGHALQQCPTRDMASRNSAIWQEFALLDIDVLENAVIEANRFLSSEDENAFADLLASSLPAGVLMRAIYDINWPAQLRSVHLFWRMRGKDIRKALKELAPEDNSPIWSLLNSFPTMEISEVDRKLQEYAHRYPADFRIPSLRGFVALEQGNIAKAITHWKEAEMFSTFPVIHAWHQFLQARALEYEGNYRSASDMYQSLLVGYPTWDLLEHRRIVCEVKRGFPELVLKPLENFVDRNGHYFNKSLLDPEMERGHIQIFSFLHRLWLTMEEQAKIEEANLIRMRDELAKWFMPGNQYAEKAADRIDKLMGLANIRNYVAFQSLAQGRVRLERDLKTYIAQEGRTIRDQFLGFTERIRTIGDESAWFPFPGALKDFTKNCNESVANLNWALKANFSLAEPFRKAQMLIEEEKERLRKLENRLKFLRIVRDSTLFVLSMLETFFWLEFGGIILIFVVLPLLLLYGDKIGLDLAANLVKTERWHVQKTLFFVLSIFSIAVAGLRTVVRFESIREKILSRARAKAMESVKKR